MQAKRFLSGLLSILLIVALLPVDAFAAGPDGKGVRKSGSATYVNPLYPDADPSEFPELPDAGILDTGDITYYSTVEDVGEVLREAMKNREASVTFGYDWCESADELNNLFHEFLDTAVAHTGVPTEGDYLQWQYGGASARWGYYVNSDGSVYDIEFTFAISYYTTAAQEQEMDTAVEQLLGELDLSSKHDYEKICGIYDYMCENIVYDYTNLDDDSYKLKYTAYAALINGTSVCQGYANLFYRLALELGVDARLIAGIGNGGPHSWNIVELNDLYYNLDATWDAVYAPNYQCFLKSEDTFFDHARNEEYTTESFHAAYPMGETDYVYTPEEEPPVEDNGEVIVSGTCGDNLTWTLTDGGTLTISGEGEMEDYTFTSLAPWYDYRESIISVILEDGVNNIGDISFFKCVNLKSATLSNSVKEIGDYAFNWCEQLQKITGSENVTVIGDHAFSMCRKLVDINLSEGLTSIGDGAFHMCDSFTSIEIPDSATTLGKGLFYSCENLVSVTLPEGLTVIGEEMFYHCENLASIEIPESVTSIGDWAFDYCASLETLNLSSNIMHIGERVFGSCYELVGIHVDSDNPYYCSVDGVLFSKDMTQLIRHPSSRVIFGTYTIPDGVTTICNEAFDSCRVLLGVTIPDSVTSIGEMAFNFCYSLDSITIPDSVTSIGDSAFSACWELKELLIPAGVIVVGEEIVSGCLSLTNIEVAEGNENYCSIDGILFNKDRTILMACPIGKMLTEYVVADGVTTISDSAFYYCEALESITIPDSAWHPESFFLFWYPQKT